MEAEWTLIHEWLRVCACETSRKATVPLLIASNSSSTEAERSIVMTPKREVVRNLNERINVTVTLIDSAILHWPEKIKEQKAWKYYLTSSD